MISIENVSRRGFLKGVVGAGAFVLGVRLMPVDLLASGEAGALDPASKMNKAALHPSVYVAIDTDGTAYIVAVSLIARRLARADVRPPVAGPITELAPWMW